MNTPAKKAKKNETKERGNTADKAQELQSAQIGSRLNTKFGNVQTMQLAHQVNSLVNTVVNAFVQMMPHFKPNNEKHHYDNHHRHLHITMMNRYHT